ncbi:MAG: hypothetical protein R3E64_01460 [Halioglobus sp.]
MKQLLLSLLVSTLFVFVQEARSEPMTLEACKRVKQQIARYDDLRRHGGSITQMEAWKKSRAKQEDKFRKGKCKKYGKAVRKGS